MRTLVSLLLAAVCCGAPDTPGVSATTTETVLISTTSRSTGRSTVVDTTTTPSSLSGGDDTWHAAIIAEHNKRRAEWAGLPAVTANMEIAANAQVWVDFLAETCDIYHSTTESRQNVGGHARVGENIWRCLGGGCPVQADEYPVWSWTDEVECYHYAPYGDSTQWRDDVPECDINYDVGHFTQVFWDMSSGVEGSEFGPLEEVGCARARCKDANGDEGSNVMVACQYGPAGNLGHHMPFSVATAEKLDELFPWVITPTSTPAPASTTTTTPYVRPTGEPGDRPSNYWFRELGCLKTAAYNSWPSGWFHARTLCFNSPSLVHEDCCLRMGGSYFAMGGSHMSGLKKHHNGYACFRQFPEGEFAPQSECDQTCRGGVRPYYQTEGEDFTGRCGGGCGNCPYFPIDELECNSSRDIECGTRWSVYSCDIYTDEPAREP